MKKLISMLLTVAIVVAAVAFFAPKLFHNCGDCGETFYGTGYEPNALLGLIDDTDVICKECAQKHHAVEIALGKELEDYRIPLFG